MLLALLDIKPQVMERAFSGQYLTLLLCDTSSTDPLARSSINDGPGPNANAVLAAFFGSRACWPFMVPMKMYKPRPSACSRHNTAPELEYYLRQSCDEIDTFVRVTCDTKAFHWAQHVVDYSVRTLTQSFDALGRPEERSSPGLPPSSCLLLAVISMLCSRSAEVADLYRDAGILSVIEGITFRIYAPDFGPAPRWHPNSFCHLILQRWEGRMITVQLLAA